MRRLLRCLARVLRAALRPRSASPDRSTPAPRCAGPLPAHLPDLDLASLADLEYDLQVTAGEQLLQREGIRGADI